MFVFVMLSCLFLAVLLSPAGKMADLLALLFVVLSCVLSLSYTCGVWVQVWNLIVSIPDLCLPLYILHSENFYIHFKMQNTLKYFKTVAKTYE